MLNENVRRCKHIKTNGIQCGSPAVRESNYCYFHRQAARDFPKRKAVKEAAPEPVIELAVIDDADGIHYAILQVIRGIANGTLTDKASGKILYALQILSANYKQTSFYQQAQDEYKASDLDAYQMWDRMTLEDNDRKRKELFELRKAELEKLERTCAKCGECKDERELSPEVPPMKEKWPEDPNIDDYAPRVRTIRASEETPRFGSATAPGGGPRSESRTASAVSDYSQDSGASIRSWPIYTNGHEVTCRIGKHAAGSISSRSASLIRSRSMFGNALPGSAPASKPPQIAGGHCFPSRTLRSQAFRQGRPKHILTPGADVAS
jgi:hypothetical protein